MSAEQLHDLDISLRQLNVHLRSSITNQFRLDVIRGYNLELEYPEALPTISLDTGLAG
jgi:hypothetical protein